MKMNRQTTKTRILSCRFCQETFISRQALRRHINRHKKNLICSVCGHLFGRKYALEMHMKKYADEDPYECNICDKKFHIESRRDLHMLTHSEENPFVCKICGKHFTHKQAISRHHETHVGRKLFKCKVCKKAFSQKGNMKRHLLTHVGARPFFCEVCGKSYSLKAHLMVHRLVHDGRKPFACDICGEQFSTRRIFKDHYHACKEKSGSSVEVINFFHSNVDGKGKNITISVGGKTLGCIDIECKVNLYSDSASNKHSNDRHGTSVQLSKGNLLGFNHSETSDKSSCRTNPKLFFSKSDFSDFTSKDTQDKTYKKIRKFSLSKHESPDSAATEAMHKICSTDTTEFCSNEGKIQNILNLNNEDDTEMSETSGTEFESQTFRDEAPRETSKSINSSELVAHDGKALHFIKLTSEEFKRTGEVNTRTEYSITEGKAQHFIKLTNEAVDETNDEPATVLTF